MKNIREQLDFFENLIHCGKNISLWSYKPDGTLLAPSHHMHEQVKTMLFIENTFNYARSYGEEHDEPVLLSNSLNMLWIAAFEKEKNKLKCIHIIGPVLSDDMSLKSIQKSASSHNLSVQSQSGFREFIRWIPVLPVTNFLQYGMMLHFCVTGKEMKVGQFHYQVSPVADSAAQRQEESATVHGTWSSEQTLLKLVEDGNLNYREYMNRLALNGSVGKLSVNDSLRQMKNTIISSVVLVSRAAVRGGLQPELSYTLSDKYIQAAENCTAIPELGMLNDAMMNDYIQRVHDLKTSQTSNTFIESCKNYIEVHLTDEIDLKILANELGYTPYYLSRKFRKESGTDLRIYIRDARLDLSRLLLKDSVLSVQDISEELHFCSQSYFSQHFKERFGVTPLEYRNTHTQ